MSLLKFGEAHTIQESDILDVSVALQDPQIYERFQKFAQELKKVAPKAEDFIYFSAIMMHASEASLLNSDGTFKKDASGNDVQCKWVSEGKGIKWWCSDSKILPYKNANNDSFPEAELIKAHKNWVGKPLCVDHKSSSVDHVRGLIVDTFYDKQHKRVIALCALDKVAYPDLAHKVTSGVSNSVSMGTGVGKSVCFQCGNMATNANEFCDHVKYKTAYCEINYELQPIELSIVVNPADQKARIKEIFAAANHIENYLSKHSNKSNNLSHFLKEFGKLSDKLEKLSQEDLTSIENELHNLSLPTVIEKLNKAVNRAEDMADVVGDRDSSTINSPSADPSGMQGFSAPQLRWAEEQFSKVFNSLNKLSSLILEDKEEQMSEKMDKAAWYQGGGGVNEPTPGQRKYPADPLNEKDRNGEDKHMVGKSPFPNTGDPSKLFPGDEEKKKKMSRASSEERMLRRKEALDKALESVKKEGWYQGGGGVNEPTPGKAKYPKDPLNEQDRNKGDKHMNPKPADIKPEGLLGGKEEEKKKELMSRASASTKLKFVKAAKPNGDEDLANSAWQVFVDGKLVFAATVDEISNGRSEVMYDGIATKEFGKKMFAHVVEHGVEKTASMYKKAQAPAPADMAPPAPAASPSAAPVVTESPAPAASPAPSMGGEGDPKEKVITLAENLRDMASDLVDGVRALVGEQKEMGELDELAPKSASTRALFRMRASLNKELTNNFKSAVADLKDRSDELNKFAQLMDQDVDPDQAPALIEAVNEAMQDAETAKQNSLNLIQAFRKYVSSTEVLVKRAEAEARLEKSAQEMDADYVEDKKDVDMAKDESDVDMAAVDAMLSDLDQLDLDMDKEEVADVDQADGKDSCCAEDHEHDENCVTDGQDVAKPATPAPEHKDMAQPMSATAEEEFDVSTKAGRMAYRAKLAAKGKEFMSLLHDAHPKGGVTLKDLGGDSYVEDLVEVSQKVRDLATAPVKVKKQAEKLHQLISEGKLDASNLDELVAEGVDAEAIKYYRDYYGELGPEGKEFAKELTKEHAKAEVERQVEEHKVKLARAYDVANEMASVGLIPNQHAAISTQVKEIMEWNDASFASMKRVIATHAARTEVVKTAGRLPTNGYLDENVESPKNLKTELEQIFNARNSGRTRKF